MMVVMSHDLFLCHLHLQISVSRMIPSMTRLLAVVDGLSTLATSSDSIGFVMRDVYCQRDLGHWKFRGPTTPTIDLNQSSTSYDNASDVVGCCCCRGSCGEKAGQRIMMNKV
jgi:hypothetical protein